MGAPIAVVHGYYRFTDVFFEWSKALPNPEDVGPLKAILAWDALVHPDHPLRKPGVDGIEFYIATFPNGVARPVFSSGQLEFIQQWLFAMGLTKAPIPLPSSDFLLRQEDMASCAPAIYNNATKLKKAIKDIDKSNKRLKGSDNSLTALRLSFERVRTLWAGKVGTWLAIDIEEWERDHTVLTEFGWSLVRWDAGEMVEEMGHWIVKENAKFHNGTWVADRRNQYDFGTSEHVPLKDLKQRVGDMIRQASAAGPLFLVFHDPHGDLKTMNTTLAAPLTNLTPLIPDGTPADGMYVVDTRDLFAALEGDCTTRRRLDTICTHLRLHVDPGLNLYNLHNAGNDAHATMLCLRSMALGDPIDLQREKRWPGQSSSTEAKVVWSAYDGDSDFSDPEDVMGALDD